MYITVYPINLNFLHIHTGNLIIAELFDFILQ